MSTVMKKCGFRLLANVNEWNDKEYTECMILYLNIPACPHNLFVYGCPRWGKGEGQGERQSEDRL